MIEIGLSTDTIQDILRGRKTIELRLRTAKFVTLRVGDHITLRSDAWDNGRLISSETSDLTAVVTKTQFFNNFEDALSHIDYKQVRPESKNAAETIAHYKQFYVPEQIQEAGVVAISFDILNS